MGSLMSLYSEFTAEFDGESILKNRSTFVEVLDKSRVSCFLSSKVRSEICVVSIDNRCTRYFMLCKRHLVQFVSFNI